MRTIFDIGMRRSPWDGALGQEAAAPAGGEGGFWGSLVTGVITGAGAAYQAYEKGEIAEEQTEAKEAEAEAARARAEAERAKAAAEQAKARAVEAGGIPTGYLVLGGLGVVAAVVTAIVLAK